MKTSPNRCEATDRLRRPSRFREKRPSESSQTNISTHLSDQVAPSLVTSGVSACRLLTPTSPPDGAHDRGIESRCAPLLVRHHRLDHAAVSPWSSAAAIRHPKWGAIRVSPPPGRSEYLTCGSATAIFHPFLKRTAPSAETGLIPFRCGETGIRTRGTGCASTHAFQACALSHSAISPKKT